MPFIRRYVCANPIECPKSDKQMLKLRATYKSTRNSNAKYYIPSYSYCKYNVDAMKFYW